ncbi:deoxyribose-phosphate aldolase [Verrucomicrobium sp. GAS474]|uniref:deoxyribose-phosphate aldolase n=1 Tax=Verrucomicrobium sp. GAS474 TaxID=1882831 RepID=UPI00087BC681|nr:deoxyribose-phosphate aldolase [Verrucomicrobium sp. GAS474]SDT88142.1 deoxyribose-phosphate aldolase [Verrucomicrobium sp. GAS474]
MKTENLNELIDHTLLASTATRHQITHLCDEAREYGFFSVCVNPYWIADCRKLLAGSAVKVCTVVGFPLGATLSLAKFAEARAAIEAGADELDMVINIGAAKEGHWDFIEHEIHEIASIAGAAPGHGRLVKVILETAALTPEEIVLGAKRAEAAGAQYVKTSTGFGPGGATVEAVAAMRGAVGCHIGVKASGGIKTRVQAEALIAAGATRIGSSASVALVTG